MSNILTQAAAADSKMFWGELAPCEHIVQIYKSDGEFLSMLERFVIQGLEAGEGVVVIVTAQHARDLESRLTAAGIDLDAARSTNNFLCLDAERTLALFMDSGWPDEDRFRKAIKDILSRVGGDDGRQIRAFGEMVAVLWSKGHNAATVRLERLWHRVIEEERFPLFCAYPKIGFTDYALKSLADICDLHTRVILHAA